MLVFTRRLLHTAVYWEPLPPDSSGQRTFATGVELPCRWINDSVTFLDRQGNQAASKAYIYFKQVLFELGFVYRGTLAGLTDIQKVNPIKVKGAWEIRKCADFDSLIRPGQAGQTQFKVYV